MDIAEFYHAVIEDFTKGLRDQLSKKEQGLDEEVINQMKSVSNFHISVAYSGTHATPSGAFYLCYHC